MNRCMLRFARGGLVLALALVSVSAHQQPAVDLWLAPGTRQSPADAAIARAVVALADGRPVEAIPVFSKAVRDPIVGGYATLFLGRAHFSAGQLDDAKAAAEQVMARRPSGYLHEAALWLLADAAEAKSDWTTAVRTLQQLTEIKPLTPAAAYLRLGRAALKLGDETLARTAFTRIYYEYPLTAEAPTAASEIAKLALPPEPPSRDRFVADLGRAERLFGARRFADACKEYGPLRDPSAGDERQQIELRLAECEFQLGRHASALNALKPHADRPGPRQAEATYYYLSTMRLLGRTDEYVALVKAMVDAHPNDALSEAAMNELGTHYILADDDGKAAAVFAEQYRRFPQGVFADRAAWKAGWWAFKTGNHAETVRIFETAATTMRRADYRPSWLYWAARAHGELGARDRAIEGYRRVIADYRNSYYGRIAAHELEDLLAPARPKGAPPVSPVSRVLPPTIAPGTPPANTPLVQRLLQVGMYDEAIYELRKVQSADGSSPLIEATIAYAYNRKGDLRSGITAMRRAYPQFMASGGEALPREILTVIFPIDYWDVIHRHATARKLDPFLMAALVAQESTFQPAVRSAANAYGMMQIVPDTGRRYAQKLGIRPFSTARLTDPQVNIRIGMAYFADLLAEFGDAAPALAAYNAGEHRIRRWVADRPGVARDQFIDDIPFPETQNYVKRILGTAEDYRLLYRTLKPTARTSDR